MEQDRNAIIVELNGLNKARQVVVGIALVLLIGSFIMPGMALAVLRSLAWAAAGVICLMHASKSKAAGLPANYGSAIIYFLVAVLPVLRGR